MMLQTPTGLYQQAATKRADLEKQAALERQLREINTPHALRNKLASALHHLADRLAPEHANSPQTRTA